MTRCTGGTAGAGCGVVVSDFLDGPDPGWAGAAAPAGRPAPGARRRGGRPARAGAARRRPAHPGRPGDRPPARGVDRAARGCASGTPRRPRQHRRPSGPRCAGPARPTWCCAPTGTGSRHRPARPRPAAPRARARHDRTECLVTFLSPGRLWLLLGGRGARRVYLVLQRRRSGVRGPLHQPAAARPGRPARPGWRRHAPAAAVPGHARPAGGRLRPAHRGRAGAAGAGHRHGRGGRVRLDGGRPTWSRPARGGQAGGRRVRRPAAGAVQRRRWSPSPARVGGGRARATDHARRPDRDRRAPARAGHGDRRGRLHLPAGDPGVDSGAPAGDGDGEPPPARIVLLSDGDQHRPAAAWPTPRPPRPRPACRCPRSRTAPRRAP